MENFTRCQDSFEPLLGIKLPRGQAGVSILWPKEWNNNVKKLEDGNERILAIAINCEIKLCIINAYLPAQNTDSCLEYQECLDILYDIITKYQESYKIILCGDLNGTLLASRSNKHDRMIKQFISETGLHQCCKEVTPTFYHHAQSSESQIDYILISDSDLCASYKISPRESINVSAHCAVTMETTIKAPTVSYSINQDKIVSKKTVWADADVLGYNHLLQELLQSKFTPQLETDQQFEVIVQSLVFSEKKFVPTKVTKLKGPRWKASPRVKEILHQCKRIYKIWKQMGKPDDNPLKLELIQEKRKLRSQQRIEHAQARSKLYSQIMEKPDSQMFFRLIKRNTNFSAGQTNCIRVKNRFIFSPAEQRKAFANYYEDLSLPKDEQFDNSYLELCRVRQALVEEHFRNCKRPISLFTNMEIKKAIGKLNRNKSKDEYDISAEHLIMAKDILAPFLRILFNKILQQKITPAAFKSGILFPVLKREKDSTVLNNYRGITVTPTVGKHLNMPC